MIGVPHAQFIFTGVILNRMLPGAPHDPNTIAWSTVFYC